jgi:hypothetical protein
MATVLVFRREEREPWSDEGFWPRQVMEGIVVRKGRDKGSLTIYGGMRGMLE